MRTKVSTVISVAGIVALFIIAWRSGGEHETPEWNQPPTPAVIVNWCTPVAVPLYQNGTDCQ